MPGPVLSRTAWKTDNPAPRSSASSTAIRNTGALLRQCYHSGMERDEPAVDASADLGGVPEPWEHPDDALITWMLSLTPAQRLEALQGWVDSIQALRDGARA